LKTAVLFGSVLALSAPAAAPAAQLIPRELASLTVHSHTLVQLGRDDSRVRAAGGVRISKSLGVWRIPSRAAQRLIPKLALGASLRDFEPDVARMPLSHAQSVDPLLPQQWWRAHVGADRVEPPGPGKPVTVIDSGLDITHPEFASRPDTAALNRQTLFGRGYFHGTAVSSVVGAPANGIGLVGVYPQAALRSWDASPDGFLTSADVVAGIDAASQLGAGVITLSLGGPFRSRFEAQAILQAMSRGSIVVAAVGNEREDGSPLTYPASLPHVLTVGSTDGFDRVSTFSSSAAALDLAAPGERIPVAVPTSFNGVGYENFGGTSFAAPIVAGAVAWVWTARPELDNTQIFDLMRRSARDLGRAGRDIDTGFGLLDIPTALTAPAPPPDSPEPNDGVEHVAPGGLFPKPALTEPGRPTATLSARLDVTDDPRDVYRAWVPAGRRVTATLRTTQEAELQLLGTRPRKVTAKASRPNSGTRVLTITNRAKVGTYLYISAWMSVDALVPDATYTLNLKTTRAPR
jgi:subtilisin family serine protease